ncbi:uncharacterized protein QC763_705935 [Podospora pseudopauciseta]|uniref:Uncharacterized protein n=2 Tax=Podospora TaxID=5144 RepID=A0ABR0H147_9PEZI|nr:hypothetical protein QC763_705935 [Podospora pseudopauciseta]KAK4668213.1 hypothetical protein QC764_705935 [Podospora pseudoanserina]
MFNHNRIPHLLLTILSLSSLSTAQDDTSSVTSASFLSLSDLQLIPSLAIPISCILSYNAPILNCRKFDIAQGQCTIACRRGIRDKEDSLRERCSDVAVTRGSWLWLALQGGLGQALCRAPGQGTVVTSTIRPTASTSSTMVRETTVTRSEGQGDEILTFTTVRPTSSSAVVETTTTTTTTTTTSEAVRGDETTTSLPTIIPTFVQSAGPSATSSEEAPAATGGGDEENVVVVPGGGGGSPFDTVLAVNAGESLKERSNLGLVMGTVIGIGMMFWR